MRRESAWRGRSAWVAAWGLAAAVLLAACSHTHYVLNAPLRNEHASEQGYAAPNLARGANSDSLLLIMTISGGGYRAAALGLGALDALRQTPIHWQGRDNTMLGELDLLGGVSGGGLMAAYYGLHREATFQRFETEVLQHDLQSAFAQRALTPRGLWRQTSSHFGRGDIMQELLDEAVFHGKTFADLARQRPLVTLHATDMELGGRFEFTQDQFDLICSDLNALPLSRAVAATMAAPLIFSPVTLWNYRDHCPLPSIYEDMVPLHGRYIHLLDGGLADNTGVQTTLESVSARGGIVELARLSGFKGIRKAVFIIVNAQVQQRFNEDGLSNTPGLLRQFRSLIDIPIDRYSAGSIGALKSEVLRWRAQLYFASEAQLAGTFERDADFYVIEVSLVAPPEGVQRLPLNEANTSLRISPEDSRALQRYAREALVASPEWQRLMRDLRGE
jgi:NTE family protein